MKKFVIALSMLCYLCIFHSSIGHAGLGGENMSPEEQQIHSAIMDFCSRIVGDFNKIQSDLKKIHPEWSNEILAGNLMEFGRGQISGIEEPAEKDLGFISKYVNSINFQETEKALFTAYAGGCIMGLVQSDQLLATDFINALKISAHFAQTELNRE